MSKQPFHIDDLFLLRKPSDLHCAPDQPIAACVVRSIDREADCYRTRLWALRLDGSQQWPLTQGPGRDSAPRWSPDGRQLAFLSDRLGAPGVFLLPRDGGEGRPLGRLPGAVSGLRWVPDGSGLVVSAAVPLDPEWRGERPQGRQPAERKVQPEIAWKLPYKSDGIGYTLGREIHLFHLDTSTGEHRQLTDGAFDVLAFDVAPDGQRLAYVRTRAGRFAHGTDLWVGAIDGSQARQLTRAFATAMSPAWSPDGRRIAFSATRDEGDAQATLWLLDVATAEARQLGGDDLQVADPESVRWSDDGRHLLCVQAHRGRHRMLRVDPQSGQCEVLCRGDRQLAAFDCWRGRMVFVPDHPSCAPEVHVCEEDGRNERAISDFNPWWRERLPVLAESWQFDAPDGQGGREQIEGWLLRAEGSTGPLPLLDDVHGGPASYALLDFDTNVYWQVLCSQGWAVLALNAVGSATYGREFCGRLEAHWGEYDLPQHLAAIEQLRREGVCDERLAIAGKSYGGYLSGWAIGHTHQFRAAVVMAPVGNIETHYGTSDGGYYADPYYTGSGEGRFDRRLARRLSPLQHVERATTPTLFLQGAADERCPKCQSEELFVSLMRAGETPTELVLYPGEDHHFLSDGTPSVRADAARRIIDWLCRHVDRPTPPLEEQDEGASEEQASSRGD